MLSESVKIVSVSPRAYKVYQPSATCSEEGGRNHQTSHFVACPLQSSKQLGACPKLTEPPNLGCALSNQSSNLGHAPSNQLSNKPCTHHPLLPFTWISPSPLHSLGLLLPPFVSTAVDLLSPSLSHLGQQGSTHPSTPFVYDILGCGLMASVRTYGDNAPPIHPCIPKVGWRGGRGGLPPPPP
jgi:hypothetical protein